MELRASSPCSGGGRLFPPLDRELVDAVVGGRVDPGHDPMAREVFSLARAPDGVLARWTGRGLDGRGRLGRVLRTHLLAVACECDGRHEAADFYWSEFRRAWPGVAQDVATWAALAADSTGERLCQAYTVEVLIESACALANAQAATDDPRWLRRAEQHCVLVAFLVPWSGLPSAQRASLLTRLADFRTSRLQAAGRWDESLVPWREVVSLAPDNRAAADRLACIWFERGVKPLVATASLSGTSGRRAAARNAKHLQRAIDGLLLLREQRPRRNLLYELASELFRLRAIALANSGDLSAAMVEACKAVAWNDGNGDATEALEQVTKAIQELQQRAGVVRERLRTASNVQLTSDGHRMLQQADLGFGPAHAWNDSEEAARLRHESGLARAHYLWERVCGADGPAPSDDMALAMQDTLVEVLAGERSLKARLGHWRSRVAGDSELHRVPEEKVRAFLVSATGGGKTAEAPAVASEPSVKSIEVATKRRFGLPFAPWLLSTQNLPVKALAAAAILLVLIGGGLNLLERGRLNARDMAWAVLASSNEADRPANSLAAAATFLDHLPLRGRDEREAAVRHAYEAALLRAALSSEVPDADLVSYHRQFEAAGGRGLRE
jgi:tetratricopeptide (TPR) repeat protein